MVFDGAILAQGNHAHRVEAGSRSKSRHPPESKQRKTSNLPGKHSSELIGKTHPRGCSTLSSPLSHERGSPPPPFPAGLAAETAMEATENAGPAVATVSFSPRPPSAVVTAAMRQRCLLLLLLQQRRLRKWRGRRRR
ncbi:uncharacterized protein LOC127250521 [Andrographis paniculata]|uniref:uncharacterized protein LOC127250521 n=1 Tax=Andrographis paniculata TaxID=175694 RepID=UPI0021E8B8E8|nr:uncharacterized protein LOC127250521 [Andrographis paniculata]